jgi:3,4-dihydroxy 2-butanone 4-phosphate synthase / GTP cyclohydrolase II
MPFASIPEAIELFRAGKMLVVVDDEDRENEGDLTVAADKITPELINFMAVHGRGLICLALSSERCDALDLPLMSASNTSQFGTAFCEAIDAREGVTTGISAADRARTIQVAIDPASKPQDLARPGHMFPLRAREGGVLVRGGQTEAAVDLARLAGLQPGGVICEIMNEDGTMARVPQLKEFCSLHGLKMISVADLIRWRIFNERIVKRSAEGTLRTEYGVFRTISYSSSVDREQHRALIFGDLHPGMDVLVRVQSHCAAGNVFGAQDCDCQRVLRASMAEIARQGAGVLVYLHETAPAAAHAKDNTGVIEVHGTRVLQHEVGVGAQILADLGLRRIRILINRPRKIVGLEAFGIEVVEQVKVVLS